MNKWKVRFTDEHRAAVRWRGVVLGKRPLRHHEFPRTAWLPPEIPIGEGQVRTYSFELRAQFSRLAALGNVFHLLGAIYEPRERFEPGGFRPIQIRELVFPLNPDPNAARVI